MWNLMLMAFAKLTHMEKLMLFFRDHFCARLLDNDLQGVLKAKSDFDVDHIPFILEALLSSFLFKIHCLRTFYNSLCWPLFTRNVNSPCPHPGSWKVHGRLCSRASGQVKERPSKEHGGSIWSFCGRTSGWSGSISKWTAFATWIEKLFFFGTRLRNRAK